MSTASIFPYNFALLPTFFYVKRDHNVTPAATMQSEGGDFILPEYDAENMLRPDYTVMMVGARGSGKTIMMLYFLNILARVLDLAVAFMPTTDTQEQFAEHIQKCFIYPDYDEKELARIVDAQKFLTRRKPSRLADGSYVTPNNRRVAVILDDCMYDPKSGKGKTLRYLFMNGRHDNFFFMNAAQYVMDMNKSLRSQIDLVVAFPTEDESIITPLRENLLGCFRNDEQLKRMFQALHENEALVYDRRRANKKQPCLFFCKAKHPLPKFRVGNNIFWEMYYKHFVRSSSAHIDAHIQNRISSAKDNVVKAAEAGKAVTKIIRKKKQVAPMMAALPDLDE